MVIIQPAWLETKASPTRERFIGNEFSQQNYRRNFSPYVASNTSSDASWTISNCFLRLSHGFTLLVNKGFSCNQKICYYIMFVKLVESLVSINPKCLENTVH